jgi:hypothetical protein
VDEQNERVVQKYVDVWHNSTAALKRQERALKMVT